jgi:hypothetical protein
MYGSNGRILLKQTVPRPGRFASKKSVARTHWIAGRVGPTARGDALEKSKISFPPKTIWIPPPPQTSSTANSSPTSLCTTDLKRQHSITEHKSLQRYLEGIKSNRSKCLFIPSNILSLHLHFIEWKSRLDKVLLRGCNLMKIGSR